MIDTQWWKGGITNDKKYFSSKVQEKVLTTVKKTAFERTDVSSDSFFKGCWLLVIGCWLVCSYYNAGARYCLPDSRTTRLYKSRDFVPGYSRCARYCLPDRFVVLLYSCLLALLYSCLLVLLYSCIVVY